MEPGPLKERAARQQVQAGRELQPLEQEQEQAQEQVQVLRLKGLARDSLPAAARSRAKRIWKPGMMI
jgi:hypothetical protein